MLLKLPKLVNLIQFYKSKEQKITITQILIQKLCKNIFQNRKKQELNYYKNLSKKYLIDISMQHHSQYKMSKESNHIGFSTTKLMANGVLKLKTYSQLSI